MAFMEMIYGIKPIRLVIITTILFLCGCTKNNNGYSELILSVPEKQQTKTSLHPNTESRLFEVVWDEGDQVKVFDNNGGSGIYTNLSEYEDNERKIAHFGGEGVDVSSTITSFYPASIALSSNTFVLPYEQAYRGRDDGYMYNYPMWARETGGNHIYFRNLTGILILRVRGLNGTQIRKVYVKDPSDPHCIGLRGTYSVSCNGSTHTKEPNVTPVSTFCDIMVNCGTTPIVLSQNQLSLFYFSVPGGIYERLIIGFEYKLSYDSEWNTTYQTIFPQTYGKQNFKFERSKWTPIDIDITDIDASLVYKMDMFTFNPIQSGDTIVNTDIPITNEFGEYTFAIDLTPDDITSLDNNGYLRKTIYSEMDNSASNWNGILIRLAKQNNRGDVKIEVDVGNSTSVFSTQAITSGVRHQIVVTIKNYSTTQGTITLYFKRNNVITNASTRFNKTKWVTTTNPTPQIGGDQHISGRYFDGTIHSFRIYNRVWTSQEINTFITQ